MPQQHKEECCEKCKGVNLMQDGVTFEGFSCINLICPCHKEEKIEIVPSPRIDWCSACQTEHGYDCPKEQGEGEEMVEVIEYYTNGKLTKIEVNGKQDKEEWEKEFDEKFAQDQTGEKVEGWLAMNTGRLIDGNETEFSKIATPSDIHSFISKLLQSKEQELRENIEGMRKYHREFECNGANNGKGCYETWCEDQNCRNAPKEYNQALSDILNLLSANKD